MRRVAVVGLGRNVDDGVVRKRHPGGQRQHGSLIRSKRAERDHRRGVGGKQPHLEVAVGGGQSTDIDREDFSAVDDLDGGLATRGVLGERLKGGAGHDLRRRRTHEHRTADTAKHEADRGRDREPGRHGALGTHRHDVALICGVSGDLLGDGRPHMGGRSHELVVIEIACDIGDRAQ